MPHRKKINWTSELAIRANGEVVVDFLGAIVPRHEEPRASSENDLSNIIPFVRNRSRPIGTSPEIVVALGDRIAYSGPRDYRRMAVLLAGSLTAHMALYIAFHREPSPQASVGLMSISIELVLGTDRAAGMTLAPSESETESVAAAASAEAGITPPASPEIPDIRPAPGPQPELQAQEKPPERTETPKPPESEDEKTPRKPEKEIKRTSKDEKLKARDSHASIASRSSSGIGRGRSDANSNYRGLVAAHLARHKRYPAEARSRGEQGNATMTFRIDGSGHVTSVRLVRSSRIVSFDHEAQAMVQRASPFPAPPSGRSMTFTVPVSFHLR